MSRSAKAAARGGTVLASARHVLGGDLMRGAGLTSGWCRAGSAGAEGSWCRGRPSRTSSRQPSPSFPTAWARTPAMNMVREGVQRFGLGPLLRSEVQPVVARARPAGADGAAAGRVRGQPRSHMDTPLILCSLPADWRRRTAVAAAADYFFDTWWRATGSAIVFNTFPIERRGGTLSSTPGDLLAPAGTSSSSPRAPARRTAGSRQFRLGAAFLADQHRRAGRADRHPRLVRRDAARAGLAGARATAGDGALRRAAASSVDEGVRELGARVEAAVGELVDEDAATWWEAKQRAAAGTTPSTSGPDGRAVAPGLGPDRVPAWGTPDPDLAPLTGGARTEGTTTAGGRHEHEPPSGGERGRVRARGRGARRAGDPGPGPDAGLARAHLRRPRARPRKGRFGPVRRWGHR